MRKVISTIILVCLLLSLAACSNELAGDKSLSTKDNNQSNNKSEVAVNTTSADFDHEKYDITDRSDSGVYLIAGINTINGHTKFFFRKFSGVRTITKLEKDTAFDYESSIESGKLKVLIMDEEYNVLKVLEANSSGSIKLDLGDTKAYIIRAVGEDAYKGNVIINVRDN